MTILTEFGVEGRLEREDYLQGLTNLKELGELSFENTRWFLLVDFRDVEICRRRRTNTKRNQRFVQSGFRIGLLAIPNCSAGRVN